MKQMFCSKIYAGRAPWAHETIPAGGLSENQITRQEEIDKCLNCTKKKCNDCLSKSYYIKKK